MLLDGEVDGAILGADILDDPRVTHLIPNPKDAALRLVRASTTRCRSITCSASTRSWPTRGPDVVAEIFAC